MRELTIDEINTRIGELEEERFRLRFRSATETLEEPLRLRVVRREVARLKTVVRERERGVAAPKAGARAAATADKSGRKTARGGAKS
jgi:large subunit ribosomal protein L29